MVRTLPPQGFSSLGLISQVLQVWRGRCLEEERKEGESPSDHWDRIKR
jgi:hypothetical protein